MKNLNSWGEKFINEVIEKGRLELENKILYNRKFYRG